MKLELSKILFRPSLFEEAKPLNDFNKQLANAVWQQKDVAAGKLALKLFDSPDLDINEEEKGYIKEALEGFVQWVKSPVLEAIGD